MLVDEASGVDDRIFQAALGTMPTSVAITVLAGNPMWQSGFFYDTHTWLAERWTGHRVSSEDMKRTAATSSTSRCAGAATPMPGGCGSRASSRWRATMA